MRRIALAILILIGSCGAAFAGPLQAIQTGQSVKAEKINFPTVRQETKLNFLAEKPTRDRPAMSTPQDATRMAYGCSPGSYICHTRNGDICCPNNSNCSYGGYCY